jgi:hypothetical protein
MLQDVKQEEQKRTNTKSFIALTKKYTDIQKLDGAIIREFIDKIEISANENGWGRKTNKSRKIHIVYNFIGAFDFSTVSEITEVEQKARKTA